MSLPVKRGNRIQFKELHCYAVQSLKIYMSCFYRLDSMQKDSSREFRGVAVGMAGISVVMDHQQHHRVLE